MRIDDRNLEREFAPILAEAGFPTIAGKAVGRQFMLAVRSAPPLPYDLMAIGTITAVYHDAGKLTVFVSLPECFGFPLLYLSRDDGKWRVHIREGDGKVRGEECQFDLI